MKKLILVLFIPIITSAQESSHGELFLEIINRGSSWDVTFTLTAVSPRWDENFDLTENYETMSETLKSTVCPTCTLAFFEHILHPGVYQEFAIGLYKISAIENGTEQAYFYMDWRTDDWSNTLDIKFKYDVGNDRFRDKFDTQTIDYSYQTIWDLTENLLETSDLEDYWENCLVLLDINDDHPYFVWGPHPTAGVDEYRIYRKIGSSSFLKVEDVGNDVYGYLDESVTINPPGGQSGTTAYYFIKGVVWEVPEAETSPTDTVDIEITSKEIEKSSTEYLKTSEKSFNLHQNYPNPFNPITTIGYSIKKDGFVTLKVFDILGSEIVQLVNENKTAGKYSINFNASDLPGGIYFYTLSSGNFQQTRKLILLK